MIIVDKKYSVEEVLNEVQPFNYKLGKHYVDFDGDKIKMESQRYRLFKRDGVKCVKCNIEGIFFRKERNENTLTYHFNLYAIKDGIEILMTKDHKISKYNGGKNHMSNYQVMCSTCNNNKGKNNE